MRAYLATEHRVYVNNVIATLPSTTRISDPTSGRQILEPPDQRIRPVQVEFPREFNTIGLFDGQHRVYSYHEGTDSADSNIARLRSNQHLLVTAIIYPSTAALHSKQRFEAQLFLEINDKQKRLKSDLKQSIQMIIDPYSAVAIAKAVLTAMAETGPLAGQLEAHYYDAGKIKTASIVSYGLRHIVSLDGEHSFFKVWRGQGKRKLRNHASKDALDAYVRFCVGHLNQLISGFRAALPPNMWSADKKESRVLTTTTINGLVFCMRKLIEAGQLRDFDFYRSRFERMTVRFSPSKFAYKSSHWKSLGERLFADCFQ